MNKIIYKRDDLLNCLMDIIFFCMFSVASWDLVGKIVIKSYSLRSFYFFEIVLFFLIFFLKKIKVKGFIGWKYFAVWTFFIGLWIPNTTILVRNIGYFFWLLLSGLLLVIFSSFINKESVFTKIFRFYLYSFAIMAFIGCLQFLLGMFGISLWTTQWWIPGIFPRINGFSYEPSYYGTYLIVGAIILYWLSFVQRVELIKFQKFFTFFIQSVVIICSSRMSILILSSFISAMFLWEIYRSVKNKEFKKSAFNGILVSTLTIFLSLWFLWSYPRIINAGKSSKIILQGTGINKTSPHSVKERLEAMCLTFQVFLKNPIIGVSLGGIPYHIAQEKGVVIHTQKEAKKFEGINVLLEVLAASGIVGFVFFVLFFYEIFKTHFLILRYPINKSVFYIANALGIAFIGEFLLLMLNQNILRPYFWVLLGFYISSLMLLKNNLYSKNGNGVVKTKEAKN